MSRELSGAYGLGSPLIWVQICGEFNVSLGLCCASFFEVSICVYKTVWHSYDVIITSSLFQKKEQKKGVSE